MRRFIKLVLLSIRDLLTSAGPSLLLIAGLLVAAYVYIEPQPPGRVVLATGPEGSAYAGFGRRYAMALRAAGIDVELVPTQGAADNLRLLREGLVDVAFVRGGLADSESDEAAGLVSLGSLFFEPIWIFYRLPAEAEAVPGAGAGSAPGPASSTRSSAGQSASHPAGPAVRAAAGAARPPAKVAVASPVRSAAAPGAPAAPAVPAPAAAAAGTRLTTLLQLKGLRVSVDQPGSGVPEIMDKMLEANRLSGADLTLSHQEPAVAVEALLAGDLDAIVLASAPESSLVQRLLRAPDIGLMDMVHSDAYTRLFAFLSDVTLVRGVVSLARDLPPDNVSLLAATTSLLSRDQTHPALRVLFARHAQRIHGDVGWFNRARDFPNTRTSELPVSPEGDRAINGSPPFWDRYLPFWASNLLERMWLVIGGLIVLLLPLSRIVPPLYTFQVRRRVFRWYARLREIEGRMARGEGSRTEWLDELDELDRVANGVTVPLSHAEELYALRSNIERARRRLLARGAGAAADGDEGDDGEVGGNGDGNLGGGAEGSGEAARVVGGRGEGGRAMAPTTPATAASQAAGPGVANQTSA